MKDDIGIEWEFKIFILSKNTSDKFKGLETERRIETSNEGKTEINLYYVHRAYIPAGEDYKRYIPRHTPSISCNPEVHLLVKKMLLTFDKSLKFFMDLFNNNPNLDFVVVEFKRIFNNLSGNTKINRSDLTEYDWLPPASDTIRVASMACAYQTKDKPKHNQSRKKLLCVLGVGALLCGLLIFLHYKWYY